VSQEHTYAFKDYQVNIQALRLFVHVYFNRFELKYGEFPWIRASAEEPEVIDVVSRGDLSLSMMIGNTPDVGRPQVTMQLRGIEKDSLCLLVTMYADLDSSLPLDGPIGASIDSASFLPERFSKSGDDDTPCDRDDFAPSDLKFVDALMKVPVIQQVVSEHVHDCDRRTALHVIREMVKVFAAEPASNVS